MRYGNFSYSFPHSFFLEYVKIAKKESVIIMMLISNGSTSFYSRCAKMVNRQDLRGT